MSLLGFCRRLMRMLRPSKAERDMHAEMQAHLEMQAERNSTAGMSPDEARYAARRQFGSLSQIQERSREVRRFIWVEQFFQDLRFGLRGLARNPGFTAGASLTLALGIGATTVIFSVAYAVLLRPLPFAEPERLVALWTQTPQVERLPLGAADHRDLQAQNSVFEDIALLRGTASYNLTGEGEPERLLGAQVTANFFGVLRVQPVSGRSFSPEENQPGNDHVVLLSHGLWQRRFAGDPGIVGKVIRLENTPYTVIGVMDAAFEYPSPQVQIWTPLTVNPASFQTRTGYMHRAIARLRPGIEIAQAQADVDTIAARLAKEFPGPNQNTRFTVTGLRADVAGSARAPLLMLLGAALGLLLIGCCNLVNLFLARALSRSRETAVRAALGATRARLVRQTLAEILPLLALGTLMGVIAAVWGLSLLIPALPATLPRLEEITVNPAVLFGSGAVLFLATTLVAIVPARWAARSALVGDLAHGSRGGSAGGARNRVRHALIVAQVALTVMLVASAGLLARSFAALRSIDPGFESEGVLTIRVTIPNRKYRGDEAVAAYCGRILEHVRNVPGVAVAGMGNRQPLSGTSGLSTVGFARGNQAPLALSATDETTASPDYFRAMGIPLLRGRTFTEHDTMNSAPVVIVDEEAARLAWPGEDPIGQRLRSAPDQPWAVVIGVVRHVRHETLEHDQRRQVYWNYRQRPRDRMTLAVRTTGDPRALVAPVIAAIRSVDPDQPVSEVRTMEEVVERYLALRRFNTTLVGLFAGSSLLLAMIGVYGVMSWTVRQRTREIGIRVALGAQRGQVLGMVLRSGLRLTGTGIVLGLAGAAAASFVLRGLLFGVGPADPLTFVSVPLVLVATTLFACWLPARRAAKVDPVVALRAE